MTRTFTPKDAVREAVPLFVGIVGPSGGGKTTSALRLATGIQQVVGGDIHFIDTENRRGLHYADQFNFKHVQFDPPFASLDYKDAIEQSASAGAGVVIVDSMSLEHEGPGGMIDYQEREVDRLAGENASFGKRQAVAMLAWQKPKSARRQLLQAITRTNAHVICCFRAKNTSKPVKVNGRTEVVPMGFVPICGDELQFEMALSALLLPGADGRPTWRPENPGEKQAVKLPRQFRWLEDYDGPLDENVGKRLAEWAKGGGEAAKLDDAWLKSVEERVTRKEITGAEWQEVTRDERWIVAKTVAADRASLLVSAVKALAAQRAKATEGDDQ